MINQVLAKTGSDPETISIISPMILAEVFVKLKVMKSPGRFDISEF